MKLEHVALSVTDRKEIERFYQDILGMEVIRSFQLDQALAVDIFGIPTSAIDRKENIPIWCLFRITAEIHLK